MEPTPLMRTCTPWIRNVAGYGGRPAKSYHPVCHGRTSALAGGKWLDTLGCVAPVQKSVS
jgi:hypothetical protein